MLDVTSRTEGHSTNRVHLYLTTQDVALFRADVLGHHAIGLGIVAATMCEFVSCNTLDFFPVAAKRSNIGRKERQGGLAFKLCHLTYISGH
jgi:hypothetical protein